MPAISALTVLACCLLACSDSKSSYFPVEKGNRWQYEIETNTVEGARKQKDILQALGPAKTAEAHLYRFRSASGQESIIRVSPEEVRLVKALEPRLEFDTTLLRFPIESGNSWESVITTSTIATFDRKAGDFIEDVPVTATVESLEETVLVPAGKFRHCLKVSYVGEKRIPKGTYAYQETMTLKIINNRWYAKGVGLVREEHQEISGVLEYPDSGYIKVLDRFSAP